MNRFICFFLLLCIPFIANAQMRQLSYYTGSDYAVINDSKVDHSGNIVSVGNHILPNTMGGDYGPFILKTDKQGNLIWYHSINPSLYWTFSKIEIARNGDYLIAMRDHRFGFYRTDSNGNMVASKQFVFDCNTSGPGSIAELPDRRLVYCGETCYQNGNNSFKMGFIIVTDSVGNTQWKKEYRFYDGNASYGFYDIAVDSTSFYIVGQAFSVNERYGLFLVTDHQGNERRRNLVKYDPNPTPIDVVSRLVFEEINVFESQIYLSGTLKNEYLDKEKFIIGVIDTVAETFTGNIITAGDTYEMFNKPKVYMYEYGKYFLVASPKPVYAAPAKAYFISLISGSDQMFTKKVPCDSVSINCIHAYSDTVLVSGYTKKYSSTYLSYLATNATVFPCNVQDTTLTFEPIFRNLTQPDYWITPELHIDNYGSPQAMDTLLSYEILICDETTSMTNDFTESNKFLVYPNPVSNVINIFNPVPGDITIDIFDISGRSLYSVSLTVGYHSLSTHEMNLSSGMYILKVRDGKSDQVHKIFIQ